MPDQRQQAMEGQATRLTLGQLRSGFADPPRRAAPGMRWWWFGPSVTRPELERELRAVADAGLSGVEVAFVYPLAEATTAFGSETFLEDLRFAAELAHRLGLRFELTLGSGWSFGGPHISTELAARQLHWEQRQIGSEALQVPVASPWPGDDLVAAYLGAGSLQEPPVSYKRLPLLNGQLRIEAGIGPRVVLLAYGRLTGQQVKRAAAGAEGPVLDHYSATATEAHLRAVADPMLDAVPATLVGSVFCDSLEAYGADWTPALPAEFARRRGYDLLPELYRLTVDGPDAATVRADYHRTLSELYQENFVAVCQRWAAARGVPFRIQSYGTPPATISSYRFADLFEGEGWGWRDIPPTRWASSAAHLYGCATVSAEAWTWVHSPSYRATPLDLKGEAHEHLLNGVNRLIGHGWPYSPADAPGMGWFFYAAGALDDRNPWWPAMPGLARYLSRLCWLLQQGEPVADVALYVPNQDLFATMGRAQGGSLDAWREAARRIPRAIPAAIRSVGFDFDLIDDDALAVTAPPDRYRVVIVPATTMLLDSTRDWFDEVARIGGSLITVDSSVELPGAVAVTADRLADVLLAAVPPDLEISPPSPDTGFVHRGCPDCEVYFLVNTGPTTRTFSVLTRTSAASYEQWDPASGRVLAAGPAAEPIGLELHPYQATVLVLHDQPVQPVSPRAPAERRLPLNHWQAAFPDEPVRQVPLPHVWEDQPGREHYSGAATYTTSIELASAVDQAEIDFGECEVIEDGAATHGMVGPSYRVAVRAPVGEIAAVRVNSIDCGLAWAPPYRVDVSDALRRGSNDIQVMICNTGANAVAADEHIRRLAADSEARYGRRFRMQDLDQAMATVRSGLLQKPALVIADDRATEG